MLGVVGVVAAVVGLLALNSAQSDENQARDRLAIEQEEVDSVQDAVAAAESELNATQDGLDGAFAAGPVAVETGGAQQGEVDQLIPDLDRQVQLARDQRAAAIAGNFGEFNRLVDENNALVDQVNAKALALQVRAADLLTQLEDLNDLAEAVG